jgi:L-aspartate oxidase
MMNDPTSNSPVHPAVDVLVIGSGIAGLSFALKAARHGQVAVVTKKEHSASATNYAQGGISAALDPLDHFDAHIQDTLTAGAGLCRREVVEQMVRAAPALIGELMDLGVAFTRREVSAGGGAVGPGEAGDVFAERGSGKEPAESAETPRKTSGEGSGIAPDGGPPLSLGREGGHSRARVVHARDLTGREVERALVEAVTAHPRIRVYENHAAVELLTRKNLPAGTDAQGGPRVWGAYVHDRDNDQVVAFPARITLLATGGCGQVYRHTTNPDIATGDGLAMAARVGVPLENLEFMQFHPTALFGPADPAFLISEAVRGFGGILRDHEGEAFMAHEHPLADLAPRDIVARAIDRRLKAQGIPHVYLDLTHRAASDVETRFPVITRTCRELGIDPTRQMIPVVPAAHYMCGGIQTDSHGRTQCPGLFAVGETACTGVHGANRLASNSLLEGLHFAHRAARRVAEELGGSTPPPPEPLPWDPTGARRAPEGVVLRHDRDEIRQIMWDYVGIVRTLERLQRAERRLALVAADVEALYRRTRVSLELIELRNLAQVALLITRSALSRRESRGLHYLTDHPEPDPALEGMDTAVTLTPDFGHQSS